MFVDRRFCRCQLVRCVHRQSVAHHQQQDPKTFAGFLPRSLDHQPTCRDCPPESRDCELLAEQRSSATARQPPHAAQLCNGQMPFMATCVCVPQSLCAASAVSSRGSNSDESVRRPPSKHTSSGTESQSSACSVNILSIPVHGLTSVFALKQRRPSKRSTVFSDHTCNTAPQTAVSVIIAITAADGLRTACIAQYPMTISAIMLAGSHTCAIGW